MQFDSNGKRINYVLHVTEKQRKQKSGDIDATFVFESLVWWDSLTQKIIDERNETDIVGVDINRHTFKVSNVYHQNITKMLIVLFLDSI